MKSVSVAAMRELDRRTIEEAGIPGAVLMDRAGRALADVIRDRAACMDGRIDMLAGPGNNGGDVFAAARHLRALGLQARVLLAAPVKKLKGAAREHYDRWIHVGGEVEERAAEADWAGDSRDESKVGLLVDGLLGTGAGGAPRGAIGAAVHDLLQRRANAYVVAVDVPSGLDADTAEAHEPAVRADVTVTMGLPKNGLLKDGARAYAGRVIPADLGFPAAYTDALDAGPVDLVTHDDVRAWFPERPVDAHKGDFGHVWIVGGSRGLSGAPVMAARAALRGGAGLVSVLTPESVYPVVAGSCTEAMVHPGAETAEGVLRSGAIDRVLNEKRPPSVILAGPGLTPDPDIRDLVDRLLAEASCPLVLDADALNVLAGRPDRLAEARASVLITPHPGEMARLTGRAVKDIQADRVAAAQDAADEWKCVVLLKGAGTVVAAPGQRPMVNTTGNPGLAKGGSGDTLGGLAAACIGQGLSIFQAAAAAAFLHGAAADRAARAKGVRGLLAGDVAEAVPEVMRRLVGR